MAVMTIVPDAISNWSEGGYSALTDASDGTYCIPPTTATTGHVDFGTFTIPAGSTVTNVRLRVRAWKNGTLSTWPSVILKASGTQIGAWSINALTTNSTWTEQTFDLAMSLTQTQLNALTAEFKASTSATGYYRVSLVAIDVTTVAPTVAAVLSGSWGAWGATTEATVASVVPIVEAISDGQWGDLVATFIGSVVVWPWLHPNGVNSWAGSMGALPAALADTSDTTFGLPRAIPELSRVDFTTITNPLGVSVIGVRIVARIQCSTDYVITVPGTISLYVDGGTTLIGTLSVGTATVWTSVDSGIIDINLTQAQVDDMTAVFSASNASTGNYLVSSIQVGLVYSEAFIEEAVAVADWGEWTFWATTAQQIEANAYSYFGAYISHATAERSVNPVAVASWGAMTATVPTVQVMQMSVIATGQWGVFRALATVAELPRKPAITFHDYAICGAHHAVQVSSAGVYWTTTFFLDIEVDSTWIKGELTSALVGIARVGRTRVGVIVVPV